MVVVAALDIVLGAHELLDAVSLAGDPRIMPVLRSPALLGAPRVHRHRGLRANGETGPITAAGHRACDAAPSCLELDDLRELHEAVASSTMLKGVSATRCRVLKPAAVTMSRSRASPAWAPRAVPTSWASELGVQSRVENP